MSIHDFDHLGCDTVYYLATLTLYVENMPTKLRGGRTRLVSGSVHSLLFHLASCCITRALSPAK
jgi:hypothetical protein